MTLPRDLLRSNGCCFGRKDLTFNTASDRSHRDLPRPTVEIGFQLASGNQSVAIGISAAKQSPCGAWTNYQWFDMVVCRNDGMLLRSVSAIGRSRISRNVSGEWDNSSSWSHGGYWPSSSPISSMPDGASRYWQATGSGCPSACSSGRYSSFLSPPTDHGPLYQTPAAI